MTTSKDFEALVKDDGGAQGPDAVRELGGALDNLLRELRASGGSGSKFGLKVSVAMRVADAVLKRYPPPAG